ncbi:MAG: UDP-glucose dehydrogenase family protein [Candidatus Kapaibacterium sp.]
MPHTIAIVGTGYVGLVSGTCFAEVGNTVYCVEVDAEKVSMIRSGKSPIYEPGLEILLERNVREQRLIVTQDLRTAVRSCTMLFLCLPTPPNEDGSADLHYVLEVATQIAEIVKEEDIRDGRIIVTRSTVPVGTAVRVRRAVDAVTTDHPIAIASNPEFLREGFAVEDTMKPERVVIGTREDHVRELLCDLYEPFVSNGNPVFVMDEKSAEVTKYAANSFLATKISFMNDLSAYCETVGVDIENVRLGIGSDSRIGKRFIFPGVGYGGSCFPKDVKALIHSAREAGTPMRIVEAVEDVNHTQIERFIGRVLKRMGPDLHGMRIAVWGLAFKPNTDDIREAPAFRVIDALIDHRANVTVYDPEAMRNTQRRYGDVIAYASSMYACAEGADALIVVTEWNEFRKPDFAKIATAMNRRIIFDGRNIYDREDMGREGFEYYSVGRPDVIPS